MVLPTREIGNDNVTAMAFGLMGMSAFYSEKSDDDEERFKVLDAAIEAGLTNWDTADVYGDSEDLVGKWLKRTGKRNEIFLATKFGATATGPNGKVEYVRASAEKSLKRLGVETIDLYYLHRADKKTPIEITVSAMAEFVKAGKVRYLGLSEISSETLRRAHAVHPITAVQVEYSPFCLDIEDEKIALLKTCRELGVTVVAYSPLGRGVLAGKFKSRADIPADDWRREIPRFSDENFPNILKLVKGFEEVGKKHNATSGQVALAWLLAQGEDIIPLFGTKNIKNIKENLGAFNVKLGPEEVKELRAIAETADATTLGERYPPNGMQSVFADTAPL
ncbi:Aldo/keto reductase [Gymnopilus junonius]|uniref:Aldo/keto reductase n=1 Tax=Gymnopilus junonius TaxID=109634 RepID=A0A9P5NBM3_GYMJU|nr:Aldo/keto reductase [Gymnopilus junonius]